MHGAMQRGHGIRPVCGALLLALFLLACGGGSSKHGSSGGGTSTEGSGGDQSTSTEGATTTTASAGGAGGSGASDTTQGSAGGSGGGSGSEANWDLPGSARRASSLLQSGERRQMEEQAVVEALADQLEHWRKKGEWTKIKCMELLFTRGAANKDAATMLDLSEQQVANFKFDFIARLKKTVRGQALSEDLFPELYE